MAGKKKTNRVARRDVVAIAGEVNDLILADDSQINLELKRSEIVSKIRLVFMGGIDENKERIAPLVNEDDEFSRKTLRTLDKLSIPFPPEDHTTPSPPKVEVIERELLKLAQKEAIAEDKLRSEPKDKRSRRRARKITEKKRTTFLAEKNKDEDEDEYKPIVPEFMVPTKGRKKKEKFTRMDAIAECIPGLGALVGMRAGATVYEIAKKANKLYVSRGGTDNLATTERYTFHFRLICQALVKAGLIGVKNRF